MIKLDLPFWSNKGSSKPLIKTAQLYWERIANSLLWPLTQTDPETCTLTILNFIAYQRDITRFDGEPLWLFRLRVKYAYANAQDAGSVAGIKRIFERLGIGYVEVDERTPDRDWDVIVLRLSDNQLSQNSALLRVLLEQYGRTCRRYEFEILVSVGISMTTIEFNNTWSLDKAVY
ncbi:phage tail protein [Cellvibrio sp. QJXJ]|uniref:phage tail protein n=1 Tax=Cellvibrio sp. QJXJ TaxID=2964606 RepID=UPI0021C4C798|nr:phage tail protein [Cellvibrio sp. QJXJ]UUA73105.1 phage tail protein [Cellvibrio sp. QJXJ]